MKPAIALSSLTATYRYIKYVLGDTRPSENYTQQAYLAKAREVFEKTAQDFGYELIWGATSGYIKDIYQNRSEFSRLRSNVFMRSDNMVEFTLWNAAANDEKTALLFVENSINGYSLDCRLLDGTACFSHQSASSLDFIMKDRQWKSHEAVLRKAALSLFSEQELSKLRARYALSKVA